MSALGQWSTVAVVFASTLATCCVGVFLVTLWLHSGVGRLQWWRPWFLPTSSVDASRWWDAPAPAAHSSSSGGAAPPPVHTQAPAGLPISRRRGPGSLTLPSRGHNSGCAADAMPPSANCANCNVQPARSKCGQCHSVWYCSKDCQVAHWKAGHKAACKALLAKGATHHGLPDPASAHQHTAPGGGKQAAVEEEDEAVPAPERVLFDYSRFLALRKQQLAGGQQLQTGAPLPPPPPVGLVNCGNTCFANALLQCLLHTQPLMAYLRSGDHAVTCTRPSSATWCLLCELQKLAEQVHEAQELGPGSVVMPRSITRNVQQIKSLLTPGRQEDAHELFAGMLEQIEGIMLHQAGGKAAVPDTRSQETTFIGHCFNGYFCYQTECTSCGWISQRYDSKLCFELTLASRTPTIEACLAYDIFADEQLDDNNRYKCDKCKQMVRATRHCCLEVAPNVLVLQLKRFLGLGRFSKDNRHVAYGELLDLEPFKADNSIDTVPATYRLYGVLVHLDHMNSVMWGHYVAYVRLPDGRWFLCDDSRISQVDVHEALSQNAYMLFYLRDVPKPAPDPSLRPPKGTRLVPRPRRCKGTPASAPAEVAAANGHHYYANGYAQHAQHVQANGHAHAGPVGHPTAAPKALAGADGVAVPSGLQPGALTVPALAHVVPQAASSPLLSPAAAAAAATAVQPAALSSGRSGSARRSVDVPGMAGEVLDTRAGNPSLNATMPGCMLSSSASAGTPGGLPLQPALSTGHVLWPTHSLHAAGGGCFTAGRPRHLGSMNLPVSPSAPVWDSQPSQTLPEVLPSPRSFTGSTPSPPSEHHLVHRPHVHTWPPVPHQLQFAGMTLPGALAALPLPSWRARPVPASSTTHGASTSGQLSIDATPPSTSGHAGSDASPLSPPPGGMLPMSSTSGTAGAGAVAPSLGVGDDGSSSSGGGAPVVAAAAAASPSSPDGPPWAVGGAEPGAGTAAERQLLQIYVNLPGVASSTLVRLAICGNELLVWVPGSFLLPLVLPNSPAKVATHNEERAPPASVHLPQAYAPVECKFRANCCQLKVLLDVALEPVLFEAGDFAQLAPDDLAVRVGSTPALAAARSPSAGVGRVAHAAGARPRAQGRW